MLSLKGDSRAQGSRPPLCKYYLHIASEFTVHADDIGVTLSDLAAAHRCAVSVIGNCTRCDTEEQDWRGWHVKIADDTGRTLVVDLFPTDRAWRSVQIARPSESCRSGGTWTVGSYTKKWHDRSFMERYQAQYRFCRQFGGLGPLRSFLNAVRVAIFR